MNFREITIGKLPDFIESEEYSKLNPKPITRLRAISQFNNPAAQSEDVALVFISENNTLLAFAGLLPDEISGFQETVFSNTGWWVHPMLGRKYGLPVFFKALQASGARMFFTDCSEHTKSILEKTGLFDFSAPVSGTRFFLRFYTGKLLQRKGKSSFFSKPFFVADAFLNWFVSLSFQAMRMEKNCPGYLVQPVQEINPELEIFIATHAENYHLKQSGNKLKWVVNNPWVTAEKNEPEVNYPFSHKVENFKQQLLAVQKKGVTVALLLLSIRNNQASIPYIYFKKDYLADIVHVLWTFISRLNIDSIVIFQTELLDAIKVTGVPFIFRTKIIRFFGHTKELNPIFAAEKKFQDGEGDVAFT